LCVAAKNASEQGGTDEKELEARVRANFKERLLYMEKIGLYPGEETGLPSAQDAVAERLSKAASMWSKFQHASAKGVRPEIVNVIMPVVRRVAPQGLGSGKQREELLEEVKLAYFQKVKKASTKSADVQEMPNRWTTPAWEVFLEYGLPGENWHQLLPDLESVGGGKRANSRVAQRQFNKAVKRSEVEGRTHEMMAGKEVKPDRVAEVAGMMREQNAEWRHQNAVLTWQTQVQALQHMAMQPGLEPTMAEELRRQVLSLVSNPPQPQQFSEGTAGSAVGTGSGKGSSKASDSNVEGGETVPDSGGAGGVQEAVPQEKSEVVASGEDVL